MVVAWVALLVMYYWHGLAQKPAVVVMWFSDSKRFVLSARFERDYIIQYLLTLVAHVEVCRFLAVAIQVVEFQTQVIACMFLARVTESSPE